MGRIAFPVLTLALVLAQPLGASPPAGTPHTVFVISFTAPSTTGVLGSIRLRNLLTATNASARKGCLAEISAPVRDARRGERVRVRLDPTALGGPWCTGTYRGVVRELQTAMCPHGSACPTYVRVVRIVTRFSLAVRSAGGDVAPPQFAGITRAFACTPGPQKPGQTTPYTLDWQPATDNATPAGRIVYDIYSADTQGGEDFARPTWTTPPGVTSFRTPGLPSHGEAYFVVRARDAAGNRDSNSREQKGLDPCY